MPYVIQWVEPTEEAPDYFAPYKEEDPFYLEGIEKGKANREKIIVENFLLKSKLSIKAITHFTETTKATVLSVQNKLVEEGKLSLVKHNGRSKRLTISAPN